MPAEPGHQRSEFKAGPWRYGIDASADNGAPGASLSVHKDGHVVQQTLAAAYQMSARRIA